MTIEPQIRKFINDKIAECHVDGAAIWDYVEAVETWRHRSTRPLDAHRAIKALKREIGHPSEEIVALFMMAAAIKLAIDEMRLIEARLAAYKTGTDILERCYGGDQK